jgi:hypothetical protein
MKVIAHTPVGVFKGKESKITMSESEEAIENLKILAYKGEYLEMITENGNLIIISTGTLRNSVIEIVTE